MFLNFSSCKLHSSSGKTKSNLNNFYLKFFFLIFSTVVRGITIQTNFTCNFIWKNASKRVFGPPFFHSLCHMITETLSLCTAPYNAYISLGKHSCWGIQGVPKKCLFNPSLSFRPWEGCFQGYKIILRTLGTKKNIGLLSKFFEKMDFICSKNAENFVILWV